MAYRGGVRKVYRKEDPVVRFSRRVLKDGTTGCWLWTGAKSDKGYGTFGITASPGVYTTTHTHVFSWKLHRGEIPQGLCVLHKCDVPNCVNPDHLFTGTMKDNSQDMVAKGRARNGRLSGEANGSAKLTADQVREIRAEAVPNTYYTKSLAERYGVSRSTIKQIVAGTIWKCVLGHKVVTE